MKSKYVWIIVGLVILLFSAAAFAIIKIVPSKRQVAVPKSMETVQSFIGKHSKIRTYNDVSDIVPVAEPVESHEIIASSLSIENKPVEFLVSRFNSKAEARKFFNTCQGRLKGNIQIASINFNTSNYYYWTAIVGGEKIYLWQKDEWVVLMKGDDSKAVKALKHEFEGEM